MAPLLLETTPRARTSSWSSGTSEAGEATLTSTGPLTGEKAPAEAVWASERAHYPTGDFDSVYEARRTRSQITSIGKLEEAESVMTDTNIRFLGMLEEAQGELQVPSRHTEKAWVESHKEELRALADEWLVIDGEWLVAHSSDLVEAVRDAKARGVEIPYVTRLRLEKEKPFVG